MRSNWLPRDVNTGVYTITATFLRGFIVIRSASSCEGTGVYVIYSPSAITSALASMAPQSKPFRLLIP